MTPFQTNDTDVRMLILFLEWERQYVRWFACLAASATLLAVYLTHDLAALFALAYPIRWMLDLKGIERRVRDQTFGQREDDHARFESFLAAQGIKSQLQPRW